SYGDREFLHHVNPLVHKLGPLLYKIIGSEALGRSNIARNGKDLAILFQGKARRYERTTVFGSLDDNSPQSEAADNAIANGIILGGRSRSQGELGNHSSRFCNLLGQALMLPRVDHIESRAEHG